MFRPIIMAGLVLIATACASAAEQGPLPTANIRPQPTRFAVVSTSLPSATAQPSATVPPITQTPASAEEQYRAWIEEARLAHPYAESSEQMWALMMCESGGQPEASNGFNLGLFQFSPETWAGEWNPYRDAPISDPRSQIFATAKAWQDGHQSWWGCYG